MPAQWYAQSGGNLIAPLWVARRMGVALLKDTYVPNIDTHMRYSDVSTHEVTGTGYDPAGKEIMGRSTAYDAAANEYNLLGNDLSWGPGATFSTRYGAIYEMDTADKWLWGFLDHGELKAISNGVFQIDWTTGLLSVQAGPPV